MMARPDGEAAHTSPARRLRDACEPVAMHAVWSPSTIAVLADAGLDFLAAYVAGRGSCLGDPSGAVVAAAFAWFEPGLVAAAWDAARSRIDPADLTLRRDAATTASLRALLGRSGAHSQAGGGVTDFLAVGEVADLLADALEPADGAGRPLFSGLRARGRPVDPVQRLWWAADLAREHRGDSHVAAANAAGLGPVEMNVLTELWVGMPLGTYTATRGWPAEAVAAAVAALEARRWLTDGRLTAAGLAARVAVEVATDAQEAPVVERLGARLGDACELLDAWGGACIEAGTFPADARKRAAG